MKATTRIPPSVVKALYRREGAVAACAQRGPYHTNEFDLPILSRLLSQYVRTNAAMNGPIRGNASTIAPSAPLSDRKVAYPAAADIVSRPLPSRLRRLTQPVMSPPNRFSSPRPRLLACL